MTREFASSARFLKPDRAYALRLVAGLCVGAALLGTVGCQTLTGQKPGGRAASFDQQTYVSTAFMPMTVTLRDVRDGSELWSMDIPVDQKLVVRFYERKAEGDPTLPAVMRWELMGATDVRTLGNQIPAPDRSSRRLEMTLRDAPEYPSTEPRYRVASRSVGEPMGSSAAPAAAGAGAGLFATPIAPRQPEDDLEGIRIDPGPEVDGPVGLTDEEIAEREEMARREAERLEAERLEAERLEAERLEAERLEAERRELERAEAERLAREAEELERLEREAAAAEAMRLEEERLAAEAERRRWEEAQLAPTVDGPTPLSAEERAQREAARAEAERLQAERVAAERRAAEERRRWEEAQLAPTVDGPQPLSAEEREAYEAARRQRAEAEEAARRAAEAEREAAEAARAAEEAPGVAPASPEPEPEPEPLLSEPDRW